LSYANFLQLPTRWETPRPPCQCGGRFEAFCLPAPQLLSWHKNGCERGLIPWGEFDVLFIGGSTEWKLSRIAKQVSQQAIKRGLKVHMGRVNSYQRLEVAKDFGCSSVDGTFLTYGPDFNLRRLQSWVQRLDFDQSQLKFPDDCYHEFTLGEGCLQ
jgi:hypothetical protein